jgi:acyl-CoA dehydrogenase
MNFFLKPFHLELQKELDRFAHRIERVDYICEDASIADAYIKTWAKTQHAMVQKRRSSKTVIQYLKKIESRGFTSEGILGTVSREIVKLLGSFGFLKHCVPSKYGGVSARLDPLALCVIRRALGEKSTLVDVMFAMQGLGSCPITLAGSEALKKEILPDVARGKLIAAIAITEPNAGSDMMSIETTAQKKDNAYLLNGVKTLISNAGIADFYVVLARTGERDGKPALGAFVVDRASPGLSLSRKIELAAPHPIGEITFRNVEVPASNLLGKEDEGFTIVVDTLDLFRTSVGAAALGMATRALKEALDHTAVRRQFGRLLSDFQSVRFDLAEMATSLRASELMVFAAAHERAEGTAGPAASMAKLYATEAAQQIIDRAVQLHGGLGVVRGTPVERLYRSIRALRIYEGTSEIQKVIIARHLLGG